MNEAHTFQRIVAFVVDVLLISLITSLLTFSIPQSEKYKKAAEEESTLLNEITSGKAESSEAIDKLYETRYVMEKETIPQTCISIVLTLGYFATFAFYNKGQTLGKKITHIKVVNNEGNEASHIQMFYRTAIIHGVIASIINNVLLLFIKSNQYSYTVGVVNIISSAIIMVSIFFVIFRKDKKGLHDIVCKTKVIETN